VLANRRLEWTVVFVVTPYLDQPSKGCLSTIAPLQIGEAYLL